MARRRRYKTQNKKRNVGLFLLIGILAVLLGAVFSAFMLDFINAKVYDSIAAQFFTTTSEYLTSSIGADGLTTTYTATTTITATEAINIMDKVMSVIKVIFNILTPLFTLSVVIAVFKGGKVSLKKLAGVLAVLPSFYISGLVIAILTGMAILISGAGTFTVTIAQIIVSILGIVAAMVQIYLIIDMFEAMGFKLNVRL